MTKYPYKASKAWHHSVLLASDIERVAVDCAVRGEHGLGRRLKQASQSAHRWLADSHQLESAVGRLDCYRRARSAVQQVQEDLSVARGLHFIDGGLYDQLAAQAITVYRLLTDLIRRSLASTS
ncbi:MAG: four helix bundle protein [Candidatus Saccharimonadales bacterium]